MFLKRVLLFLLLMLMLAPSALSETGESTEIPVMAPGYVLLTLSSGQYWIPLPAEGETTLPIRQTDADGSELLNVLYLTPEGMKMESANCDNQDCVHMGWVTLENRGDRALMNMIMCLPHYVLLELYTPEEVMEMYAGGDQ